MPLIFINPYHITDAFTSVENLVLAMDFEAASWVDLVNPGRTFGTTGAEVSLSTATKINGTKSLYQSQQSAGRSGVLYTPRTTDLTFEGDFWMEFWAYTLGQGNTVFTGGDNWFMSYGRFAATGLAGFFLDDLQLAFSVQDGAYPRQIVKSTVATTNNAWHHYAVGRQNGVLYLFLDGVKVAQVNYTDTFGYGSNLTIGGNQDSRITDGSYSGINGYMDRLRIYKGRCLSITDFTPLNSLYA